jgi:hypothetical protein
MRELVFTGTSWKENHRDINSITVKDLQAVVDSAFKQYSTYLMDRVLKLQPGVHEEYCSLVTFPLLWGGRLGRGMLTTLIFII